MKGDILLGESGIGAKIADLIGLEYESTATSPGLSRVAVAGSAALLKELRQAYLVRELLPGTVEDCIRTATPNIVVIEEATVRSGVWAGHVTSEGPLSPEFLEIVDWSSSELHEVIIVKDGIVDAVTYALREIGTEFFPNSNFFSRPRTSGMALPKLYRIVDGFARTSLIEGNTNR